MRGEGGCRALRLALQEAWKKATKVETKVGSLKSRLAMEKDWTKEALLQVTTI